MQTTYFHMGYMAFRYGLKCPTDLTEDQKAEWKRGWDEGVHAAMKHEYRTEG